LLETVQGAHERAVLALEVRRDLRGAQQRRGGWAGGDEEVELVPQPRVLGAEGEVFGLADLVFKLRS
jgi:hypothetical protein